MLKERERRYGGEYVKKREKENERSVGGRKEGKIASLCSSFD